MTVYVILRTQKYSECGDEDLYAVFSTRELADEFAARLTECGEDVRVDEEELDERWTFPPFGYSVRFCDDDVYGVEMVQLTDYARSILGKVTGQKSAWRTNDHIYYEVTVEAVNREEAIAAARPLVATYKENHR